MSISLQFEALIVNEPQKLSDNLDPDNQINKQKLNKIIFPITKPIQFSDRKFSERKINKANISKIIARIIINERIKEYHQNILKVVIRRILIEYRIAKIKILVKAVFVLILKGLKFSFELTKISISCFSNIALVTIQSIVIKIKELNLVKLNYTVNVGPQNQEQNERKNVPPNIFIDNNSTQSTQYAQSNNNNNNTQSIQYVQNNNIQYDQNNIQYALYLIQNAQNNIQYAQYLIQNIQYAQNLISNLKPHEQTGLLVTAPVH